MHNSTVITSPPSTEHSGVSDQENVSSLPYILLYALYCPLASCSYVLFIYVTWRHWTIFACPHYIILVGISVCDCVGILTSEIRFLTKFLPENSPSVIVLRNISFFSMTSFAWYSTLIVQILMAINRFVVVAFYVRYPLLFTRRRSIFATAFCIVAGACVFAPVWIGHVVTYGFERPFVCMSQNWEAFEISFSVTACIVTFLFYTMSMRYLKLTRSERLNASRHNGTSWKVEARKTAHGFVSTILLCLNQTVVLAYPNSFADKAAVLLLMTTSPTLCFLLDKRLRCKYAELVSNFVKNRSRVRPETTTYISTVGSSVENNCHG